MCHFHFEDNTTCWWVMLENCVNMMVHHWFKAPRTMTKRRFLIPKKNELLPIIYSIYARDMYLYNTIYSLFSSHIVQTCSSAPTWLLPLPIVAGCSDWGAKDALCKIANLGIGLPDTFAYYDPTEFAAGFKKTMVTGRFLRVGWWGVRICAFGATLRSDIN